MSFEMIRQSAKAIIEASYIYDKASGEDKKKIEDYMAKLANVIKENVNKLKDS